MTHAAAVGDAHATAAAAASEAGCTHPLAIPSLPLPMGGHPRPDDNFYLSRGHDPTQLLRADGCLTTSCCTRVSCCRIRASEGADVLAYIPLLRSRVRPV